MNYRVWLRWYLPGRPRPLGHGRSVVGLPRQIMTFDFLWTAKRGTETNTLLLQIHKEQAHLAWLNENNWLAMPWEPQFIATIYLSIPLLLQFQSDSGILATTSASVTRTTPPPRSGKHPKETSLIPLHTRWRKQSLQRAQRSPFMTFLFLSQTQIKSSSRLFTREVIPKIGKDLAMASLTTLGKHHCSIESCILIAQISERDSADDRGWSDDISGIVEAVGENVVEFKKGDRVAVSWSFLDFCVHPQILELPQGRNIYMLILSRHSMRVRHVNFC